MKQLLIVLFGLTTLHVHAKDIMACKVTGFKGDLRTMTRFIDINPVRLSHFIIKKGHPNELRLDALADNSRHRIGYGRVNVHTGGRRVDFYSKRSGVKFSLITNDKVFYRGFVHMTHKFSYSVKCKKLKTRNSSWY